jgi:hypothetical protein
MKKNFITAAFTLPLIAGVLFSCSKQSHDNIIPTGKTEVPFEEGPVRILPVAKNDTPYGNRPLAVSLNKLDTPYGRQPIRIIPMAKLDTPYGK